MQIIRYQLGNHLGSVMLELDDKAEIISFEEYFPYGNTSYQAARNQIEAPKRYRYTEKERDEESGFYYYGARYYAPWLGRWSSCDPMPNDNLYLYTDNNPVVLKDLDGRQSSSDDEEDYEVGLMNSMKIQIHIINKYGIKGYLGQDAAKESERLRNEQRRINYEKSVEESKPPNKLQRFGRWLLDWFSEKEIVKKVSEVDDSLKKKAGDVGGEIFKETFGPIQRGQQLRLEPSGEPPEFYTNPENIGRGAGGLVYENLRDSTISVMVGTLIPLKGGKFKMYWNKQELEAAEFVWRTEGKLWRREAEIWIMKGNKLEKTRRRLDAVLFDIPTGEIDVAEWTTAKSLAENITKRTQLEYQRKLFEEAKKKGWTLLARPSGEKNFYFITNATQRTEQYPHWRKTN